MLHVPVAAAARCAGNPGLTENWIHVDLLAHLLPTNRAGAAVTGLRCSRHETFVREKARCRSVPRPGLAYLFDAIAQVQERANTAQNRHLIGLRVRCD